MAADTVARLKKYILVDGFEIVIDLKKSNGSWLVDSRNDKKILDLGYGQFGSLTLGYNHPALKEKEFLEKLLEVSEFRVALSDVYHPYQADFIEAFATILPKGFNHLFFIDNGAPAVENALKVAFDWKTRKNLESGKNIAGDMIIHLKNSFHGRLGYTLSLTNTADPRKYKFFPKFRDWPRIHCPKAIFNKKGEPESYDNEELAISQINEAVKKYGPRIAGLIIEPIQGEGGDNYFSPNFFRFLRKAADENNFMLIFDEVQTGWSTGDWWTCGRDITGGVLPDIFAFAKKVQQGGIAVTERVQEVKNNVFVESSRINSTWGGNLPDMVRSTKYIEIIKKERLHENIMKQGAAITKILRESQADALTNVRGIGGWAAFTLPDTKTRDAVWKTAYEKGCLVMKSGENSIRLRPNLAINTEEVGIGIEILLSAIKDVTTKNTNL